MVAYDIYHYDLGGPRLTLVATTTGTSGYAEDRPAQAFMGLFFVRARDAAGNVSLARGRQRRGGPAGPVRHQRLPAAHRVAER